MEDIEHLRASFAAAVSDEEAGLLSIGHTAREVMIDASSDEMTKRLDME